MVYKLMKKCQATQGHSPPVNANPETTRRPMWIHIRKQGVVLPKYLPVAIESLSAEFSKAIKKGDFFGPVYSARRKTRVTFICGPYITEHFIWIQHVRLVPTSTNVSFHFFKSTQRYDSSRAYTSFAVPLSIV